METLRSLLTLFAFAGFVGILWWAYAPSRRERWQDRAELGDD